MCQVLGREGFQSVVNTTDEGLGEDGIQDMYIDDAVWVDGESENESGWNADVESVNLESSSGSAGINHGVGPSIALTHEQSSDPTNPEENPGNGCEPSIADNSAWLDHGVGPGIAPTREQRSCSANPAEDS